MQRGIPYWVPLPRCFAALFNCPTNGDGLIQFGLQHSSRDAPQGLLTYLVQLIPTGPSKKKKKRSKMDEKKVLKNVFVRVVCSFPSNFWLKNSNPGSRPDSLHPLILGVAALI